MAERFLPAAPLGPDGPYLVAILDVLDGITAMLDARLPRPVTEPAPPQQPRRAVPVQEPHPGGPPDTEDDEPEGEPVPVTEPAPAPAGDVPPRAGRGSSLEAWRAHADRHGVTYKPGDRRDDIIAACEQAGVA